MRRSRHPTSTPTVRQTRAHIIRLDPDGDGPTFDFWVRTSFDTSNELCASSAGLLMRRQTTREFTSCSHFGSNTLGSDDVGNAKIHPHA